MLGVEEHELTLFLIAQRPLPYDREDFLCQRSLDEVVEALFSKVCGCHQ